MSFYSPARLLVAASLLVSVQSALADEVLLDDLIVQESACVGTACVEDIEFDFDTLLLKGPRPSVLFQDTSNSAAFPSNDWMIGLGDGAAGQPAYLFIRDVDAGSDVFALEPGANGGVALGAGSARVAGAISVGASGSERRVVNVADGVELSDAATLGQLQAHTDSLASELSANQVLQSELSTRLDTLRSELQVLTQRVDTLVSGATP